MLPGWLIATPALTVTIRSARSIVERLLDQRRSSRSAISNASSMPADALADAPRTRRRRSGRPCRCSRAAARNRSASSLQHAVPGGVAEAVVDQLEVVDVEEQHPDLRPRGGRPDPCAASSRSVEQPAVGQAGDRIVHGLVGQGLRRPLALADVGEVDDDPADRGIGPPIGRGELDPLRSRPDRPPPAARPGWGEPGRPWPAR